MSASFNARWYLQSKLEQCNLTGQSDAQGTSYTLASLKTAIEDAGFELVDHYHRYADTELTWAYSQLRFHQDYYLKSKLAQLEAQGEKDAWGRAYTRASLIEAIEKAGLTVEEHYQRYSTLEGTSASPYFNTNEYLEAKLRQLKNSPDEDERHAWASKSLDDLVASLRAQHLSAEEHYLRYGSREMDKDGRLINPSNAFDANAYVSAKLAQLQKTAPEEWADKTAEDVFRAIIQAGLTPVSHYERYGASEANASGIAMLETVPVIERVQNDLLRKAYGDLVPSNYNPMSPAPGKVSLGVAVVKPQDVGELADAAISPQIQHPDAPVATPYDLDYVPIPGQGIRDTNEHPVMLVRVSVTDQDGEEVSLARYGRVNYGHEGLSVYGIGEDGGDSTELIEIVSSQSDGATTRISLSRGGTSIESVHVAKAESSITEIKASLCGGKYTVEQKETITIDAEDVVHKDYERIVRDGEGKVLISEVSHELVGQDAEISTISSHSVSYDSSGKILEIRDSESTRTDSPDGSSVIRTEGSIHDRDGHLLSTFTRMETIRHHQDGSRTSSIETSIRDAQGRITADEVQNITESRSQDGSLIRTSLTHSSDSHGNTNNLSEQSTIQVNPDGELVEETVFEKVQLNQAGTVQESLRGKITTNTDVDGNTNSSISISQLDANGKSYEITARGNYNQDANQSHLQGEIKNDQGESHTFSHTTSGDLGSVTEILQVLEGLLLTDESLDSNASQNHDQIPLAPDSHQTQGSETTHSESGTEGHEKPRDQESDTVDSDEGRWRVIDDDHALSHLTVHEAGLENGTAKEASETNPDQGSGSLCFSSSDYELITIKAKSEASFSGAEVGTVKTIQTEHGSLTVCLTSPTELSYSYTLLSASDDSGDCCQVSVSWAGEVENSKLDLNFDIVDDQPLFTKLQDTVSITGGEIKDLAQVIFGADGPLVDDQIEALSISAGSGLSLLKEDAVTKVLSAGTVLGILSVNDGTISYRAANVASDHIDLVIQATDADGSTISKNVHIHQTVNQTPGLSISQEASGSYARGIHGALNFDPDMGEIAVRLTRLVHNVEKSTVEGTLIEGSTVALTTATGSPSSAEEPQIRLDQDGQFTLSNLYSSGEEAVYRLSFSQKNSQVTTEARIAATVPEAVELTIRDGEMKSSVVSTVFQELGISEHAASIDLKNSNGDDYGTIQIEDDAIFFVPLSSHTYIHDHEDSHVLSSNCTLTLADGSESTLPIRLTVSDSGPETPVYKVSSIEDKTIRLVSDPFSLGGDNGSGSKISITVNNDMDDERTSYVFVKKVAQDGSISWEADAGNPSGMSLSSEAIPAISYVDDATIARNLTFTIQVTDSDGDVSESGKISAYLSGLSVQKSDGAISLKGAASQSVRINLSSEQTVLEGSDLRLAVDPANEVITSISMQQMKSDEPVQITGYATGFQGKNNEPFTISVGPDAEAALSLSTAEDKLTLTASDPAQIALDCQNFSIGDVIRGTFSLGELAVKNGTLSRESSTDLGLQSYSKALVLSGKVAAALKDVQDPISLNLRSAQGTMSCDLRGADVEGVGSLIMHSTYDLQVSADQLTQIRTIATANGVEGTNLNVCISDTKEQLAGSLLFSSGTNDLSDFTGTISLNANAELRLTGDGTRVLAGKTTFQNLKHLALGSDNANDDDDIQSITLSRAAYTALEDLKADSAGDIVSISSFGGLNYVNLVKLDGKALTLSTEESGKTVLVYADSEIDLSGISISGFTNLTLGSDVTNTYKTQSVICSAETFKHFNTETDGTLRTDASDTITLATGLGVDTPYTLASSKTFLGTLYLASHDTDGSALQNHVVLPGTVLADIHTGSHGDIIEVGNGHHVLTLGQGDDTIRYTNYNKNNWNVIHEFDSGNDMFVYAATVKNGSYGIISEESITNSSSLSEALTQNPDATVYIVNLENENKALQSSVSTFLNNKAFMSEYGKISHSDIINKSIAALSENGTVTGLDDALSATDEVLIVLNNHSSALLLHVANSKVGDDTLKDDEVSLVAIFDESQLTSEDFLAA